MTTLNSTPTTVEHKRKSSLFRKTNKVSQDAKTVASKDATQVTYCHSTAALNCADSVNDVFLVCWEKIEKRFSIFEFRLGINFFHFRLRSFGKVEPRLGSPEAGVEIDTG